jgi:hypothetical protein
MNIKILLTSGTLLAASMTSTLAQNQFQFVFTGTCWTTNASGKIVPRPITNATLLGQMQYLIAPDATHPNLQVCSGSFTTTKPWKF